MGLKRLGRYLADKRRYRILYEYQEDPRRIVVWTDSDFAGCARTRKSTSGGVIMHGSHLVKSWSITQAVIALSSGEAVYYAMVKGGCVGIGMQSIMSDLEVKAAIEISTDASAAKGIASRTGLGKVRHIEVSQLWLQYHVSTGKIKVNKVDGGDNLADTLTKHVSKEILKKHVSNVGSMIVSGRHMLSLAVDRLSVMHRSHCNMADKSACLLYTSPSPRDRQKSRMPSSA